MEKMKDVLMELFDFDDKQKSPKPDTKKRYVCKHCHSKEFNGKTVEWDFERQHFVCVACGHVDKSRSRKFWKEWKEKYGC